MFQREVDSIISDMLDQVEMICSRQDTGRFSLYYNYDYKAAYEAMEDILQRLEPHITHEPSLKSTDVVNSDLTILTEGEELVQLRSENLISSPGQRTCISSGLCTQSLDGGGSSTAGLCSSAIGFRVEYSYDLKLHPDSVGKIYEKTREGESAENSFQLTVSPSIHKVDHTCVEKYDLKESQDDEMSNMIGSFSCKESHLSGNGPKVHGHNIQPIQCPNENHDMTEISQYVNNELQFNTKIRTLADIAASVLKPRSEKKKSANPTDFFSGKQSENSSHSVCMIMTSAVTQPLTVLPVPSRNTTIEILGQLGNTICDISGQLTAEQDGTQPFSDRKDGSTIGASLPCIDKQDESRKDTDCSLTIKQDASTRDIILPLTEQQGESAKKVFQTLSVDHNKSTMNAIQSTINGNQSIIVKQDGFKTGVGLSLTKHQGESTKEVHRTLSANHIEITTYVAQPIPAQQDESTTDGNQSPTTENIVQAFTVQPIKVFECTDISCYRDDESKVLKSSAIEEKNTVDVFHVKMNLSNSGSDDHNQNHGLFGGTKTSDFEMLDAFTITEITKLSESRVDDCKSQNLAETSEEFDEHTADEILNSSHHYAKQSRLTQEKSFQSDCIQVKGRVREKEKDGKRNTEQEDRVPTKRVKLDAAESISPFSGSNINAFSLYTENNVEENKLQRYCSVKTNSPASSQESMGFVTALEYHSSQSSDAEFNVDFYIDKQIDIVSVAEELSSSKATIGKEVFPPVDEEDQSVPHSDRDNACNVQDMSLYIDPPETLTKQTSLEDGRNKVYLCDAYLDMETIQKRKDIFVQESAYKPSSADLNRLLLVQPLPNCASRKSLRIGLSKKQKTSALHPYFRRNDI